MGTPRQNEANRLNAQKSTGPKTEQGKLNSSRNALKHGATGKKHLTVDECPVAASAEWVEWQTEFPQAGPVERGLIEVALTAQRQLRRAGRSEAAQANKRMRELRRDELAAEHARVEELGRKLRHDPINRCAFYRKDPRTLDAMERWLEDDPPVIVRELEKTRTGVQWLQDRWTELGTTLEREGYWHYHEKFFAVRLLGRRQIDVYEDFGLAQIYAACNVAHIEGWDLVHDSIQSNLGVPSHPIYYQRVDSLRRFFPETRAEAVAMLRRVVDAELNRLDRLRRDVVDPLHAADDADAPQRALVDASPESAHLLRYTVAARNVFLKAVAQLLKSHPGERASAQPRDDDEPIVALAIEDEPDVDPEPEPTPEPEPHVIDALRDEGMARWRLDPTPYNKIEPRRDLAERREDMDPSDPRWFPRWRPEPDEAAAYTPPGPRNEPNPPRAAAAFASASAAFADASRA